VTGGMGDTGMAGWRLVILFVAAWLLWQAGGRFGDDLRQASYTSWWDPTDLPDGDLGWDDLLRLVAPTKDPMENGGILRRGTTFTHVARLAVAAAVLYLGSRLAAEWIAKPGLPPFLERGGDDRLGADALINLSGNLTAFLALTAAAASIWFANSQLRSKVRADNRQEWLANARTLLGEVVALARGHAGAAGTDPPTFDDALDSRRLRFELMLNPREKDHRLLMHLLRRLAFLREPERAQAADGGAFLIVLKKLCEGRQRVRDADGTEKSYYEAEWKAIVECSNAAVLTTYVMRLGHVVLKREWERVKAAR